MIAYPKIETLYNRDPATFKVDVSQVRCPEFENIRQWFVTEKIDGTNVRVRLGTDGSVSFHGRTDDAQMPTTLFKHLQETFPTEKMLAAFPYYPEQEVVLYGEGYGEKIQKVGGLYRKGVSFRLFDALVGQWWLEPDALQDVANKLEIKTAPFLCNTTDLPSSKDQLLDLFRPAVYRNPMNLSSIVAHWDGGEGCEPEGIVARPVPMLFNRKGERVMWKLKVKDF